MCGFGLIPFIAIYYTSSAGGGLAKDYVVASFSAYTLANALGALVLGRLGDRFGHRWGILFGAAMQAVTLGIAVLVPGGARLHPDLPGRGPGQFVRVRLPFQPGDGYVPAG